MHDFPSLIAKKLFNSRLRAFTLIEVFVAMMAAVLIGSGAVASLLASERLSARMRVLTNARIILQRKINSALGVSFTTTSTPDILSITSASGVVFNDNGAPQQYIAVLRSGSTPIVTGTVTRIVTAEPNPDNADIRRVTFRIDYTYLSLPSSFSMTTVRAKDDQ